MTTQKQIKIVGWFWMTVGGLLALLCLIELLRIITSTNHFSWGYFVFILIGLSFSLFPYFSGLALIKQKDWGGDAIVVLSIIGLLCSAIFVLFAGLVYAEITEAIVLSVLIIMPIYSLWVVYAQKLTTIFRDDP